MLLKHHWIIYIFKYVLGTVYFLFVHVTESRVVNLCNFYFPIRTYMCTLWLFTKELRYCIYIVILLRSILVMAYFARYKMYFLVSLSSSRPVWIWNCGIRPFTSGLFFLDPPFRDIRPPIFYRQWKWLIIR